MKKKLTQISNALIAFLFLGMAALVFTGLMSGCARPTLQKTHTVERIIKDSLIYLPGAIVEKAVDLGNNAELEIDRWYEYSDSLEKVRLKFMKDKFNKLQMKAECSPDTVTVNHTYTLEKDTELKTIIVNKTPWWAWLLIGAFGSIATLFFVLNMIRR